MHINDIESYHSQLLYVDSQTSYGKKAFQEVSGGRIPRIGHAVAIGQNIIELHLLQRLLRLRQAALDGGRDDSGSLGDYVVWWVL